MYRVIRIVICICMFHTIQTSAQSTDPDSLWTRIEGGPQESRSMAIDSQDRVWFSSESGAWVLDDGIWTQYTVENSELPSNTVQTIAFDSTGAVWFGTSQGAAKLDGDIWTQYTTENSGLAMSSVKFLAFDSNDGVWMANNTTLSHFIDDGWDTYSFWEGSSYIITAIAVDPNNELWVGTMSEGLWNLHGGVWVNTISILNKAASHIYSISNDANGWLMVSSNDLFTYDGETWNIFVENSECISQTFDNHGTLWGICGSTSRYIYMFSSSGYIDIYTPYTLIGPAESLYSTLLYSIDFSSDNTLWILSLNGIFTYSGSFCSALIVQNDSPVWFGDDIFLSWITSEPDLSDSVFIDIEYSVDGQYWYSLAKNVHSSQKPYAVTLTSEILYRPYLEGYLYFRLKTNSDYYDDSTTEVLVRHPNFQQAVNSKILLKSVDFYYLQWGMILDQAAVTSLIEDGNDVIWAGLAGIDGNHYNAGIWRYDGDEFHDMYLNEIDPAFLDQEAADVNDAVVDANGDPWFALSGGVVRRVSGMWEVYCAGMHVDALATGTDGIIWAAVRDSLEAPQRIYRIQNGEAVEIEYPWNQAEIQTQSLQWNKSVIAVSPDNVLYIIGDGLMASRNGSAWYRYDSAAGDAPEQPVKLYWSPEGDLRVVDMASVYTYSSADNAWATYLTFHEYIDDVTSMQDVVIDADGSEWFIANNKILIYDGYDINRQYTPQYGLSYGQLNTILIDSSGRKWLGNSLNEVFIFEDSLLGIEDTPIGVHEQTDSPEVFMLEPVYPNPFNSSTTIRYSLDATQPVILAVYSITGQKVCELVSGTQHAGVHSTQWNGTTTNGAKVASGMYFARLYAGDAIQVQKMLLLK